MTLGTPNNCTANITSQPALTTIGIGATTTFEIVVTPSGIGAFDITFSIDNNDPDDNPYVVTINGNAIPPQPMMDVQRPTGTSITNGGNDTLNPAYVGIAQTLTYTIENIATATNPLNLDGTAPDYVALGTPNNCTASVTIQPPLTTIGIGNSTTFEIEVTPSALGTFDITFSIDNDDPDDDPYVVTIGGTATIAPGEIDLQYPAGTSRASGSTVSLGTVFTASNRSADVHDRQHGDRGPTPHQLACGGAQRANELQRERVHSAGADDDRRER